MTFIGKLENLDIHLIENKGITLIDTELNQYEFYCNDPILNQLDYLETKIIKSGYLGRFDFLCLYIDEELNSNFWILDDSPWPVGKIPGLRNKYFGLFFCNFILNNEHIKELLTIRDILD